MVINDFAPNTVFENTDCLVAYLPNGRLFAAKRMQGTNLRKLYTAFAGEFTRMQDKIYELSNEDDLATTTNLIEEWESALHIPDTCLTNKTSIVWRRKQVVAKFALMHITTEVDWINLALFFGFRIRIDYGAVSGSVFTMTFPLILSSSARAARFTMVVTFLGINPPRNVFEMTFPIYFDPDTNFLGCLFRHLKPANVNLIFRWEP